MTKSYDFFISYKWAAYASKAKVLRDLVASHGYRAWLDVDHPFQASDNRSSTSDGELAAHLRRAIDSCQYVLFFETFATLARQIGGPTIRVTSWQEQELGIAAASQLITLYHGADPRNMGFDLSTRLHRYADLDAAFQLVRSAISKPSGPLWE